MAPKENTSFAMDSALAEPRLLRRIDDFPSEKVHCDDLNWSGCSNRITFVVDCQILEHLFSGGSPLHDDAYRPVMLRVSRLMANLIRWGWLPRTNATAFVEWRPREWNKGADFLCNFVMDHGMPIHSVDELAIGNGLAHGCNLQIHSDGGRRLGESSACAWTLYGYTYDVVDKTWRKDLWGKVGMPLPEELTSFAAEAIALETDFDAINTIFQKFFVQEAGDM